MQGRLECRDLEGWPDDATKLFAADDESSDANRTFEKSLRGSSATAYDPEQIIAAVWMLMRFRS